MSTLRLGSGLRPRKAVLMGLVMPLVAAAAPTVASTQAFTELVGPNPFFTAGWMLGLGATNVTPSGAGTTVAAVHMPADPNQDYTVPATPSPVFPNPYITYVPYTNQSGQWDIVATDGSGSGHATTHTLDDIRQLPLLTGLTASGDPLAPVLTWDRVDPALYPSLCAVCNIGFDFFNYGIAIRSPAGVLLAQSPVIPNTSATPSWTVPSGVLQGNQNYLIGFRLNQNELERINGDGSFFSPLENRSTAYLVHTTPVPEPGTAALWLAGLGLVAARSRRHAGRGALR